MTDAEHPTSPSAFECPPTRAPGATDPPPRGDDPPDRIGRYRILRVLGERGFGRVYLAYDAEHDRPVAIKVPHPSRVSRPEDIESYLKEARILARLDHPGIVPVYDVGRTEDGLCFVASKFIEGSDLARRIAEARPSQREAARLVAKSAEALHHAHLHGLVHRNITPANILVDENGIPRVTDFGLALKCDDFRKGVGLADTPSYISPEQAYGEDRRVDGRSDVFSLGVVLYELLSGGKPFPGRTVAEIAEQILISDVRPPREVDPAISAELERICLKSLARRVVDRYPTALDLAGDLRRAIEASRSGRRGAAPSGDQRAGVSSSRKARAISLVAEHLRGKPGRGLILILGILFICVSIMWFRPHRPAATGTDVPTSHPPVKAAAPPMVSAPPATHDGATDEVARQIALWSKQGFDVPSGFRTGGAWPDALIGRDTRIRFVRSNAGLYLPEGYRAEVPTDPIDLMPVALVREDGTRFVRITGGSFTMGSQDPLERDANPAHPVTLSGFYLQTTEVTNAEVESALWDSAETTCPEWKRSFDHVGTALGVETARRHPAVGFSYSAARAYALKRGGLLPTEAQWEYAARSRGQSFRYVWDYGPERDVSPLSVANIDSEGSSPVGTAKVASFPVDKTLQGISDLAGNVREICRDRYVPYVDKAQIDPQFLPDEIMPDDSRIVLRGGAFSGSADECKTTFRGDTLQGLNDVRRSVGFRIVIECPDVPLAARHGAETIPRHKSSSP
jgi:formylglycine-generating enzyme required for sulfatase activity